MIAVYFLSTFSAQSNALHMRVTSKHRHVFHGSYHFLGEKNGDESWEDPMLTNNNRERLHISRSGTVVPPVFSPFVHLLVVRNDVKELCSGLKGIEFYPVVFEHLVRLPMPPLGEYDPDDYSARDDYAEMLAKLPDEPALHESIGAYFSMLMPSFHHLEATLEDVEEIELDFGRYHSFGPGDAPLSLSLLQKHSVYCARGHFCMTEEAFRVLAKYLNLDFYQIDCLYLECPEYWRTR